MHGLSNLYSSISPSSLFRDYPQLEEKNETDNKFAHTSHPAKHTLAITLIDQEEALAVDQQRVLSPKLNLLLKSLPLTVLFVQIAAMSSEHRVEFILANLPSYFLVGSIATLVIFAKIG